MGKEPDKKSCLKNMCFAIPYKIVAVNGNRVIIENKQSIRFQKDLKPKVGEFIRVIGNVGVDVLAKSQALEIRRLIKKLNK